MRKPQLCFIFFVCFFLLFYGVFTSYSPHFFLFVCFIFTCYVYALFPSAGRSVTKGKAAAARWQRSPGHGGTGSEGKAAGVRGGSSSHEG